MLSRFPRGGGTLLDLEFLEDGKEYRARIRDHRLCINRERPPSGSFRLCTTTSSLLTYASI